MLFEYRTESLSTPALRLDYHLVPWDSQIFGVPVAQISELQVHDARRAAHDYAQFARWCTEQGIALCSCRLPAERMADSLFLQDRGFRFIELNYLPRLNGIQAMQLPESDIQVLPAAAADRELLADMAGQVLRYGRFHQDPRIDPALGDRRYRAWMTNAFTRPTQRVLKCVLAGEIVAFFVVEHPEPTHCFWSLVGLAPGLQGKGLGKRVWRAVLDQHRSDGIDTVSTSISSHNVAAFNLYVALGFRFPQPSLTLQWLDPAGGLPR